MKKTISILVIVAMMLASLLAIIPVAAADPEGTAVTNAEEFAAMTADGKYYLANDITLTAPYAEFKGTLDGNGKTITVEGAIPVFKNLTGATVKNLNVVADFEAASLTGNYGALAGLVNGGAYSYINADVTAVFTTAVTNSIGAIFGEVKGTTSIAGATAKGSLSIPANFKASEKGSGGIIGLVNGGTITVTDCINYFNIQSYIVRGSNGGIIGRIIATPVTIEGCVNYGKIESVTGGDTADGNGNIHCGNGGIVGQFESPKSEAPALNIKNCRNYGDVLGTRLETNTCEGNCMLGGILGRIYGGKYITIEGCINSGNIITQQQSGSWTCIGGMIGNAETWNYTWSTISEADLVIKRCVNLGNISGTATNAGGIFGGLLQGNSLGIRAFMEDCANYGKIEGSDAGGIFGSIAEQGAGKGTINNCYNEGTIIGADTSGGIFARAAGAWFTGSGVQDPEMVKDAEGNPLPLPPCALTNCINSGEVSGGTSGMIWGSSNAPSTLDKCATTVSGELTGFSDGTITNTPEDVAAAKAALLAAIPANPAELTALVEEAAGLYADDYEEGWDDYEAAIGDAKFIIDRATDVETMADTIALVKEAKAALVPLASVNYDELNAAIAEAEEIENPEETPVYTPATWEAFAAALEAAKAVPDDAKQSTVNKACNALVAAMDGLETIPDLEALAAAIDAANAYVEAEYVTTTWAAFAEVLAKAEALYVDVNATGSQVNAVMDELKAATEGLAKKVDPKPLSDKAKATEEQYKMDDYTAMTYGKVTGALRNANDAAAANDMSQATLDALAKAIDDAVAGLKKRADWVETEKVLAAIAEYRDTDYTPETWSELEKAKNAINNKMKENEKPNVSVDEEKNLLDALNAAINGLVAYATYTDINTRVGEVEAMDKTKYTADSWKVVEDALKAIKDLKSNRYATQPEADAALAALNAAVDALVEAGASTPSATEGNGGATEPKEEKKGCGSVIGVSAVVLTSILGVAFVAKKKD